MKILRKILSFLYLIIFTVVLLGATVVFASRSYLGPNFYKSILASEALMQTKISELGIPALQQYCRNYEDCTIEDAIVETLQRELGLDPEESRQFLKDSDVQEAIADIANIVVAYESTGKVEYIEYSDYERVLDKELVQTVLEKSNVSKDDIRMVIDEFNQSMVNTMEEQQ